MAFALAKENERFIEKMIRAGRFNNQSEVVREALRRMERQENSYLNPPPLTQQEIKECFASNPAEEKIEHALVKAAQASLRRRFKKDRVGFDDL